MQYPGKYLEMEKERRRQKLMKTIYGEIFNLRNCF